MLEKYKDAVEQIHMSETCDQSIRRAMERKARKTYPAHPVRRVALVAAAIALLVTTALAATLLRSQTFQEMLGREAIQWEDQIQEGILGEMTMDHFQVQVVQSLFTTDSANIVLEITPLDEEGREKLADVDLSYDLRALQQDDCDSRPNGAISSWDRWILTDGTEHCKRIGLSIFTTSWPLVQGNSFPLRLIMQNRPLEEAERPVEILAESTCMLEIPSVSTVARTLNLEHEQINEFAMTPFSITIRGITVKSGFTPRNGNTKAKELGAVQEMALLLQDGTKIPLVQARKVCTNDWLCSWTCSEGPVGGNLQLTWKLREVMDLSQVSGLQLDGQWYPIN